MRMGDTTPTPQLEDTDEVQQGTLEHWMRSTDKYVGLTSMEDWRAKKDGGAPSNHCSMVEDGRIIVAGAESLKEQAKMTKQG